MCYLIIYDQEAAIEVDINMVKMTAQPLRRENMLQEFGKETIGMREDIWMRNELGMNIEMWLILS